MFDHEPYNCQFPVQIYSPQTKLFYFCLKITLLNKRLLSVKVPDIITHCPRSLADHGTWKGNMIIVYLLVGAAFCKDCISRLYMYLK